MTDAIRRVITGHDPGGKAVVVADGPPPSSLKRASTGTTSWPIWRARETPASLTDDADQEAATLAIPPPPGGSVFRIVEFPPVGEEAALTPGLLSQEIEPHTGLQDPAPQHPLMHRTRTLDYGIVLSGEIDMLLDDSQVRLRAGDVVVQRGTRHAWVNRGVDPCRIAFILIDAKPLQASDEQ